MARKNPGSHFIALTCYTRSCLNNVAPWNISIVVPFGVSHDEMSWLKDVAWQNIWSIVVTVEVSHNGISWFLKHPTMEYLGWSMLHPKTCDPSLSHLRYPTKKLSTVAALATTHDRHFQNCARTLLLSHQMLLEWIYSPMHLIVLWTLVTTEE